MRVVAFDPGPSFGIAVWDDDRFASYQYKGTLNQAVNILKQYLHPGCQLVIEKFVISSSTVKKDLNAAYPTLYMIGAAQIAAVQAHCSRVTLQTPGERDWAVQFLPALGWYRTGSEVGQPDADDANAASAHLLKYLADTRQLPNELLTKIIDLELT
jgi:hypothetical protein